MDTVIGLDTVLPSMTCQRGSPCLEDQDILLAYYPLPVLLPQPHRKRLHQFLYAIIKKKRVCNIVQPLQ